MIYDIYIYIYIYIYLYILSGLASSQEGAGAPGPLGAS